MQKGSQSVMEYGRAFKAVCDQLTAIGHPVVAHDQVHWFLMGLGSEFEGFSTTVRAMDPPPVFSDLLIRTDDHERFMKSLRGTATVSPVAFSAQDQAGRSNRSRASCARGGRSYSRGGYRSFGGRGRRPPTCQLCRVSGHYASQCPTLANFATSAGSSAEHLAHAFHAQCNIPDWTCDTGATTHMLPNTRGDRVTKEVLAQGRREDGLYVLKNKEACFVSTKCPSASFELWHARLGHVNFDTLVSLKNKGHLGFTSLLPKPVICEPCELAKSKRLSFTNNTKRASSPLELVHCDLWGQSPVASVGNFHYYVTFVDDFSRFT
ncbi:putative RNA-directed DNA polymerase [Helianthus debilis subsp. tardiflorus]